MQNTQAYSILYCIDIYSHSIIFLNTQNCLSLLFNWFIILLWRDQSQLTKWHFKGQCHEKSTVFFLNHICGAASGLNNGPRMGLNFFNSSSQSLEFFDCFLTILCKFCLMISQNLRRHARHFGMRNYSRHPRKAPLQEYPASVIPPYRLCLALYRSPGLYLRRVWKA